MASKNAMITIAGRPNVGKSTLANTLAGEKVAIVTNKPQTTRNRIFAVVNRGDTQLVFVDTPGFHKARNKLGDYMVRVVNDSVTDVDAVCLVVEPAASVGTQETLLLEKLAGGGAPVILVINKIDTVKKEELLSVIDVYRKAYDFADIVPISARTGENVEELLKVLETYAQEGPQLFPEGMVTDQPEKQICAEIIREKLLLCLDREIPHGTAVVIERFTERENEIIDLDAVIYCEKQSHKGMIIGKHGAMLKKIGAMAREDIEAFMGTKVFLQTWVRVKENWRDREGLLKNFGFADE